MSRYAPLVVVAVLVAFVCLLGDGQLAFGAEAEPEPEAGTEEETEAVELGPVEVLASPLVEPTITTRYATQVSSVTEEQIDGLGAEDFPSAVRRVPGVTISRFNQTGSYGGREGGAVFIRGMGGARPGSEIQTLVDGVPKMVGVWTHPVLDTLNIENAERVDIYKGAQPISFGNMSFGAFNLIPKRRTVPGFETRFSAGYGMHNTWVETFEHGGKSGPWDYFVVQSYKRSRGHRDQSGGELQSYMGRLGYELSDVWDLSFLFMRSDNWAEDPGPEGGPKPRRGRFAVDDYLYILTLANQTEETEGHVKLYWDDGYINWRQFDTEPFNSVTDWDNYGVRARQTFWPWEGGEVVLGLDLDYIGGEFIEERPSGHRFTGSKEWFHLLAPYAAVSQTFGDPEGWHVIPSAGVRWTHHSDFRDVWGPQLGVVAGCGETELHAGYARGFNYPGIYAVFQTESAWGAGQAWKRLKPEILDHLELGLSHRVAPWLKASVVGFIDDGENRISFVPPPPPPPLFQNVGDFRTEGVEVSFDITPAADWSGFLGATFLTEIEPRTLPYAPKRSFTGGVSWKPNERWRVNVDGQYVSELFTQNPRFPGPEGEVDSYWLFNGRVSCDVTPPDCDVRTTLYATVENIFDEDYEYRPGYPMPGTTLMTGFDIRF